VLKGLKVTGLLLGTTLLLCSVVYPAVLLAVGLAFPGQAEGSLIRDTGGQVIGSRLIAQPFTAPEYFHPRPSACKYDASASAGSNLAASNPQLRQNVVELLEGRQGQVQADAVLASGSGLDPHITLANALAQLDRVAAEWARKTGRELGGVRQDIEQRLQKRAAAPLGGLAGVPLINVLEMNKELKDEYEPADKSE
jgi:K+-transporting ATPase KdpC subunit